MRQLIWKMISSTELTAINFALHLSVVYEILLHSMQTAKGDMTRVKYGCLCHSRAMNRLLFVIGILVLAYRFLSLLLFQYFTRGGQNSFHAHKM
jgi:hypothetical protein